MGLILRTINQRGSWRGALFNEEIAELRGLGYRVTVLQWETDSLARCEVTR